MTDTKDNPLSRRQMVNGAGVGLAAAAVIAAASPASAQGEPPAAGAAPMVDPATKHPKPPFKRQS